MEEQANFFLKKKLFFSSDYKITLFLKNLNFFLELHWFIFDFYKEADVSVTLPSFLWKDFKNRTPKKNS